MNIIRKRKNNSTHLINSTEDDMVLSAELKKDKKFRSIGYFLCPVCKAYKAQDVESLDQTKIVKCRSCKTKIRLL